MDSNVKHRTREKNRRKSSGFSTKQVFIDLIPKHNSHKKIFDQLDFLKSKPFYLWKILVRGREDRFQTGKSVCKPQIWKGTGFKTYKEFSKLNS